MLVTAIKEIHAKFRYYGSPRIHHELLARDHRVGRHRAARLMRKHGISAQRGKVKYKPRAAPAARRPDLVDLVDRDFHADTPDALWFTNITTCRRRRYPVELSDRAIYSLRTRERRWSEE